MQPDDGREIDRGKKCGQGREGNSNRDGFRKNNRILKVDHPILLETFLGPRLFEVDLFWRTRPRNNPNNIFPLRLFPVCRISPRTYAPNSDFFASLFLFLSASLSLSFVALSSFAYFPTVPFGIRKPPLHRRRAVVSPTSSASFFLGPSSHPLRLVSSHLLFSESCVPFIPFFLSVLSFCIPQIVTSLSFSMALSLSLSLLYPRFTPRIVAFHSPLFLSSPLRSFASASGSPRSALFPLHVAMVTASISVLRFRLRLSRGHSIFMSIRSENIDFALVVVA